MAHFAQLDGTNTVQSVIVVNNEILLDSNGQESEDLGVSFCKSLYGDDTDWKQTSYNNTFRKNFAYVGYVYDEDRDAFIPIKPYDSWVLNEDTCNWQAPLPYPTDGKNYYWDEPSTSWMEIQTENNN